MSEPEISAENAKVLMNDTRMAILKALSRRKYTPSELSRILGLTKPTILYHLSLLKNAGYVRRIDSRKWTYYELTDLGRSVLKWRKIKVILAVITVVMVSLITKILDYKSSMPKQVSKPLGEYPLIDLIFIVFILILFILAIYHFLKRVTDSK